MPKTMMERPEFSRSTETTRHVPSSLSLAGYLSSINRQGKAIGGIVQFSVLGLTKQ